MKFRCIHKASSVRKPKSSNILSQRKNFMKSVRKNYGNRDSHAFSLVSLHQFILHSLFYFKLSILSFFLFATTSAVSTLRALLTKSISYFCTITHNFVLFCCCIIYLYWSLCVLFFCILYFSNSVNIFISNNCLTVSLRHIINYLSTHPPFPLQSCRRFHNVPNFHHYFILRTQHF